MTGYGKVDILWLDGGWVRPKNTIDTAVDWQKAITFNQDIDMPKIAAMARIKQPGLIVVDRTVAGQYENYTTPEQQVPESPLGHPWESCITMGNSWSYVPGDKYKSANEIVNLLIKIVSRGGNLLMNIGPGPDGDWDPVAYSRLQQIGDWIKINGEGIYNSTSIAPYSEGNIYYTKASGNNTIYAFVTSAKDVVTLPPDINLHLKDINKVKSVTLLGSGKKFKWTANKGVININLPLSLQKDNSLTQAAVFKIRY
jgi:alpha-L-fucosidase